MALPQVEKPLFEPMHGVKLMMLNILLALTTFMYVLDYSIANVAIPYIAGDLAVSNVEGTYVITFFAIGNAICLPLTGWLTKRIGQVRLMIISVTIFTFLSWSCGMAVNLNMLVISRFLQGFAAGPIIPLSQGFITTSNPPEKLFQATSFWVTIVVVGPIAGPVLGGWICVDYVWPWIFYINIPTGILCVLGLIWVLKGRDNPLEKVPSDWLGLFLLATAVFCMQLVLDKGQQWDWFNSNLVITLSVISLLAYIYLFLWSRAAKHPLLDLTCFEFPSFSLASLCMFMVYGIYFGIVVIVPLWLQTYQGYNALWAGLAVAPFGVAPMLLSAVMAPVVKRFGTLIPLCICLVVFVITSAFTFQCTTEVDFSYLAWTRFWTGLGFVFFVTPVNALAVQGLPHARLPMALGIFHFIRSVAGGIGTSVFTTIWERRTIRHHFNLSEWINDYRMEVHDYFRSMQTTHIETEKARGLLNDLTDQQAAMLGFNDVFWVIMCASIALFFVILGFKFRMRHKRLKRAASDVSS